MTRIVATSGTADDHLRSCTCDHPHRSGGAESTSRIIGRLAAAFAAILFASWSIGTPAAPQQTQVQRGEYLARAGDCISCHTAQGGAPYAGGYRLDASSGYMLAPNITPDPENGIGKWSDAQLKRAITAGIRADGTKLTRTMAFDWYAKMAPADLDAIVAYLRSLKPVK